MMMFNRIWLACGVVIFWLSWPALWFYLRGTKRTRMLLFVGEEVLLLRGWLSDGKWQLPGGGLHAEENPKAGMIRELQEETGLNLKPNEIIGLAVENYSEKGFSFECHYFMARINKKEFPGSKGMEISGHTWIPASRITQKNTGKDVARALELVSERYRVGLVSQNA